MTRKKKEPVHVIRHKRRAFCVLCEGVFLGVHTERESSSALRDALAKDPEIPLYAACLPEGTKVWEGAVAAVINDAYMRESSDYANICQILWNKVQAARRELNLI